MDSRAMSRVAAQAARAEAVKTAPRSMPAAPRMPGLTARIYAMVTKVVRPAKHSRRTVVPFSFR